MLGRVPTTADAGPDYRAGAEARHERVDVGWCLPAVRKRAAVTHHWFRV